MAQLGGLYSIGGCVTFEIARRLGGIWGGHLDHFWRRPTIALMSKPVSRFRFDLHALQPAFTNYFVNDAWGAHRQELETLPPGSNVVIDITRDLITGVIEVEPGAFVMNPMDGVGIVDGLTPETMNEEILERLLGAPANMLDPVDEAERFLELWRDAVDRYLDLLAGRFDQIILLEIYFTTEVYAPRDGPALSKKRARAVNALLDIMYAHVRKRDDVFLASIDRKRMVSGYDVAWMGPYYTHYVDEAYALYCDEIVRQLTQDRDDTHSFLEEAAFERSRAYEEAKHALLVAEAEREAANAIVSDLGQRLLDLEQQSAAQAADASTEIANLAGLLAAAESPPALTDHLATIAERDQALADARTALSERDAALSETTDLLAERSASLSNAVHQISERDQTLADTRLSLSERDAALDQMTGLLAERTAALSDAIHQISDRDRTLAEIRLSLSERETTLSEMTGLLAERSAALSDAIHEIGERDRTLADTRLSLSEQERASHEATELLGQRNAALTDALALISEHAHDLAAVRRSLAQRDVEIIEATNLLSERNAELAETRRLLDERDLVAAHAQSRVVLLSEARERLERDLAYARRPLSSRIVRAAARGTLGWRKAVGLVSS